MNRRGFGRPFRRGLGGNQQIPPALQHANQLMMNGDYVGAAAAFEDIAGRADARGGPRAPFFFMQAGRARILMGESATGLAHLKHGLTLLADAKRYTQLYRAGTRIVQELEAHGLVKEAQEISALIHTHIPAGAETAANSQPKAKAVLPTHCPACGGPVRSDEADWIDQVTAECPFCGSPIRAE